ncbi:MAG: terminase large subunit [Oscillospiraceae bacterium]|nr:terminase large subunit [Oscillospiraceae bacterium]
MIADKKYIYDTSEFDLKIAFRKRFIKHTKAPFTGQPFEAMLWQKARYECLLSMRYRDTGKKVFTRSLLLVARKNGKTTELAAEEAEEFFLGSGGIDIFNASNDAAQADLVHTEVKSMIGWVRDLEELTHINLRGIWHKTNYNTIRKMTDNQRKKEGRVIGWAVLDEVHEMMTATLVKAIEQSMSNNPQRLLSIITTEGYVNDGFLDEELKRCREILDGERDEPYYSVWLYEQDSEQEIWTDENSWQKSNPSLGEVKSLQYMREQVELARKSKKERVMVLTKDFNFHMNSAEAWLNTDDFAYEASFAPEFIKGCICVGAIDFALVGDLASAKILCMHPDDNNKYILQRYFIPRIRLSMGTEEEKARFAEWNSQGLLEISEGNENEQSKIEDWFVNQIRKYGLRMFRIGFDRWQINTRGFMESFKKTYKIDFEAVQMDKRVLTSPMTSVENDFKSQLINYNGHPIDKFCFSNTAIEVDSDGYIKPVKANGRVDLKIDGTLTLIICYALMEKYQMEFRNYL